jgi:hypothetical protein
MVANMGCVVGDGAVVKKFGSLPASPCATPKTGQVSARTAYIGLGFPCVGHIHVLLLLSLTHIFLNNH